MPELPEVETIRTALQDGERGGLSVLERTIKGSRLLWERTLAAPSRRVFQRRIRGQLIRDIRRRGKYLLFQLSADTLVVHLRMSGDLRTESEGAPLPAHCRLVLQLDGGLRLCFTDARKFGRIWLTAEPTEIVGGLGLEPLEPGFTARLLQRLLENQRRRIKPLLLDQAFIAGLGNIYTDEALNLARVHPLRSANTLSPAETASLCRSIRHVLRKGIRYGGTSFDWAYRGGDYQRYLRVYHRASLPCRRCRAPIERTVVAQRGTYFCPVCQGAPHDGR
ncbi:MAG: DNA-formamidopyrimidine glycosylase [Candidatus Eisenbacteria sp.]|nr:DNA-formamidopyrimidine glycosylase [Candidatus Eisenbacteria bacterium]